MLIRETRFRSVTKGASWRIFATFATVILVFMFTGEFVLAIGVGLSEVILKLILYYLHERIWNRISWGKFSPNNR